MPDTAPSLQYSVLMTVYAGDDPDEFQTALDSCLDQTYPPAQLLVVADGPLTDQLDAVLTRYEADHPTTIEPLRLPKNRGRGQAARTGLEQCSQDLVGIMSADDISVYDRFERQVSYLESNPSIDVVGGYVAEFSENPDEVRTVRTAPTDPSEIDKLARFRSPMNEVTVMFRREAVLAAGNYRSLDRMEDYDLWVRLLLNDATLANFPEVLVKMRAGEAMYERRGGLEYAREEFRQQLAFCQMGFIQVPRALLNLLLRVPVRLLPNRMRAWIYRRFLRSDPTRERRL